MNIYDIDTRLGCWVDASHLSSYDLYEKTVALAINFGHKPVAVPQQDEFEAWDEEFWDALDFLNSVCPHGYWFEVRDNSVFLESEDDE